MTIAAANRMTLADYRRAMGLGPVEAAPRRGADAPPSPAAKKPNKYGAKRTAGPGGRMYASAAEAAEAQRLEDERQAGGIVSYLPQVRIPIGTDEKGKTVMYVLDFLVVGEVRADGWALVQLREVKGKASGRGRKRYEDTDASRAKRAMLREHCGLDVQVVRA